MTRLEEMIAREVKNASKHRTGFVSLNLKVKTVENFVYTVFEVTFEPFLDGRAMRVSEKEFVAFLKAEAEGALSNINSLIDSRFGQCFLPILYEGRMIRIEDVKEFWVDFTPRGLPDFQLSDSEPMPKQASLGDASIEASSRKTEG